MTDAVQTYSQQMVFALRMRDVPGPRIAEAVAEMQSHVGETGEDPQDAFGPAAAYADQLAVALRGESGPPSLWRAFRTWKAAAFGLAGAAGAWLLLDGVSALAAGEDGVLGLPGAVPLVAGLITLAAMALALLRMTRDRSTRILDPRTGADMVPLPRWVLPVLLAPPVLTLLLAIAVGLTK